MSLPSVLSCRRAVRLLVGATALVVAWSVVSVPAVASQGPEPGTTTTLTWGNGAGAHEYIVYTPAGWTPSASMPLMVVVHGCQTSADQQMRASLFNPLADERGFVVVYPDTNASQNAAPGPTARCWQFPFPSNWKRDSGDLAAIAGITRSVTDAWGVDAERVYLAGMSAGGFTTSNLSAAYPDLYAASVVASAGAYADGTCLAQNLVAMPVSLSASMARTQMGSRARVVPRMVIGGDADLGIPRTCADKSLQQALRTNNLVLSRSQYGPTSLLPSSTAQHQVPGGRSYTVADYTDGQGCVVGRRILVRGMGHYWSGGSQEPRLASFTDPSGPNGAEATWDFVSRFTLSNTAASC